MLLLDREVNVRLELVLDAFRKFLPVEIANQVFVKPFIKVIRCSHGVHVSLNQVVTRQVPWKDELGLRLVFNLVERMLKAINHM